MLEPQVVVQVAGVVLLDHEGAALRCPGDLGRHRFRRARAVPLAAVFGQPVGRPGAGVRRAAEVCPQTRVGGEQAGQCVAVAFHPVPGLAVIDLGQPGGGQFAPGAGHGDHRQRCAAQRVRCDRGLGGVVLAPVHEDPAGAPGFLHVADHEVGMVGLQRPRQFVRDRGDLVGGMAEIQRSVQVDAFAPAGHGERIQTHVAQDGPGQPGDVGALGEGDALARVQVEHEPIRVARMAVSAELPLRHMDFERSDLAEPGQRGQVVDQRIHVDVVGVLDRPAGDPARGRRVEVLLEEHVAGFRGRADAVHPPFPRGRPVGGMGDQHVGDGRVIGDHVCLGRAGLRVEHLVEAGERDPMAADRDDLAGGRTVRSLIHGTSMHSRPVRG